MRIYVLKVKFFRCLLFALILLLSLPVVHFYAWQIIRPEAVQRLLPRGDPLKVLDTEQSCLRVARLPVRRTQTGKQVARRQAGRLGLSAGQAGGRWVQLLEVIREYYRNGF